METEKRLIDANKLNAVLQNMAEHLLESGDSMIAAHLLYCQEVVDQRPTVDAVEVVHGKWKYTDRICMTVKCSNCKEEIDTAFCGQSSDWAYCPNCGAKMDGERRTDG